MFSSDPEEIFQDLLPLQEITLESVVQETGPSMVVGSGDQDQSAASSGVLQAVASVKTSIAKDQQSCYFLSPDHKNWSVENKIVGEMGSSGGGGGGRPQQESASSSSQGAPSNSPLPAGPRPVVVSERTSAATSSKEGEDAVTASSPSLDDVPTRTTPPFQRPSPTSSPDMAIWRQDERGLPQVTKNWDEKRRHSMNQWEGEDPTSEQHTVKGVFVAAVASLHETGFAVRRAVSRMHELQTLQYQRASVEVRGGRRGRR